MKNFLGVGTIALTALALVGLGTGTTVVGCGGGDENIETTIDDGGSEGSTDETGGDTGGTIDTGGGGDDTGGGGDDTGSTTDTGSAGDTGSGGDTGGGGDTGSGSDTGTTGDTGTAGDTTVSDTGSTGDTGVTDTGTTGPTLSINDVTITEGNAGSKTMTFTVTLSAASTSAVTVNYATADGTAKSGGGDYSAASGVVTFAPGTTTQTIAITVNGDTIYETDETFTIGLSGASGASIAKATGTGTITNDDTAPTLSINNVNATEGNSGTKNFTFTVTLSGATEVPVTVNFATANDTATAGSDYVTNSGSLTFAPGDIAKAINVTVNGDTTAEGNEAFLVLLSGASGATITDASGTGTIFNDDGTVAIPSLTINNQTVDEGNTGTKTMTFTVTLSAASTSTVTVNYATGTGGGGGVNPATSGTDFVAATGTLTFAPGETTKTISVTINGDTANELNESFFVNLSGATNATIADGFGIGTINNDDAVPSFSINDVTQTEGTGPGPKAFTFTVTLSAASGRNTSVQWATASGTATGGSDYANGNGFLFFPAGTTTQTITVNVNQDATSEANETFFINLTGPNNATISDAQGLGTITNDD